MDELVVDEELHGMSHDEFVCSVFSRAMTDNVSRLTCLGMACAAVTAERYLSGPMDPSAELPAKRRALD